MSRFIKSRLVADSFQQLIFSVIAVAGLLFMFIKAQPVDPVMHNFLTRDLRELQARDTELGEAILQHHYRLLHNYDGVVAIMQRMQALSASLALYQQNGSLPDTAEFRQELKVAQQRIAQKANDLEEFKSHNAVLKNSFIYLPRMVNDVLEQISFSNIGWHETFEFLLRDALLMSVSQSDRAHEELKQTIARIDEIIPFMRGGAKASAVLASRHAKLILEHENLITNLFESLSSHGKYHVGTRLEQLYLDYYQAQQLTASGYRLFLFLSAMLMLGYAIYAYYRMKREEEQLRIAATAFETHESIMIIDPDRRILRVNSAFTRLTGYSADEAIGKTPDIIKSDRHDDEFFRERWKILGSEGYWQGEVWNRHKNGNVYPVWLTTTAVTAADGHVTHYVSVATDIAQRKEAEEKIHLLAFYDPLTQLPNRRLLVDRLRHAMTAGTRKPDHGAILFIDLDNFKILNDTKGHDVGDQLLIETARRLQECVRGSDTVARLGGDEFVVMLEGLGDDVEHATAQAWMVGEKIRSSFDRPSRLGEVEYHCSCSIGISLFGDHETTVDDLLKRADTAMYVAKASGRNALRFFDPSMQAALENRSMLEVDLRHALAQQQFALFYQIQVNSENRLIGAEVLLRWIHPNRGVVLPSEYISLAEENGLILPIGLWVLETACAQLKAWEANPLLRELQLAINVSARQFRQPDFVLQVSEMLFKTGAAPNRLKIELTESVVLENINEAVAKMHELKKIGVSFSMDDFGTGFSSLSYLTQLPLDQVKIDQSFVHNIGIKLTDAVIVQTIISMSKSLGMEVIAEGVETEAQLAFLKNAGCMVYQGYLFSEAMTLEELENVILNGGSWRYLAKT